MIKMYLNIDLIHQILLWLPVISLLRFKSISRPWRSLIESRDFIKEHLHHQHHNPILKNKNRCLIYNVPGNYPPVTFLQTSIYSFEAPCKCLQLDCSDLQEFFPIKIFDIVSFNGIVCLNMYDCQDKQIICLWNPATRKSRILPRSPFPPIGTEFSTPDTITIGFGFDNKANDFKVVKLISNLCCDENRVEIYSFTMNYWTSVTTFLPYYRQILSSRTPFNNENSFCWQVESFRERGILCFDFISEIFRSLSFPDVEHPLVRPHLGVIRDKIACVFNVDGDSASETDVWVFTEYGSKNETWVKLCRIHPYSILHRRMSVVLLSINGEFILFKRLDQLCRYNINTGETKTLPSIENSEVVLKGFPLPHPNMYYEFHEAILEFKESLVSF